MTIPTLKEYKEPAGAMDDWTTNDFLNEVMRVKGLKTDWQLHHVLEVRPQTIYRYRKHSTTFDDAVAIRVGKILRIDPPEKMLLYMARERAATQQAKEWWSDVVKKLSIAALAISIFSILDIVDLGAYPTATATAAAPAPALYIM